MTPLAPAACKAVLFDLDGTLLHTAPDLADAVNAMLADMGYAPLPEQTVASFVGKGAENLVHRSLTGTLTDRAAPDLFERAYGAFLAHYDRLNGARSVFYDGVLEGLDAMARLGLKLAVVTNKPSRYTDPLLDRVGIRSRFTAVVSGDTCPRKKPDPMPLLHACGQMGVDPAQALMIGDSHNDAQAARAAGSLCWLLPYGYNEGHPVSQTPCDGYVDTLAHAANCLRSAA